MLNVQQPRSDALAWPPTDFASTEPHLQWAGTPERLVRRNGPGSYGDFPSAPLAELLDKTSAAVELASLLSPTKEILQLNSSEAVEVHIQQG
jgi:hypothetical protein